MSASEHVNAAAPSPDRGAVDVIYIVGYGRSGSTLLDLMLGGISGFESLGEMRYLWHRGCLENQLCASGDKFWDCPFWSRVLREAIGTRDDALFAELRRCQAHVDSAFRMPWLFAAPKRSTQSDQEYLALLDRLYCAIRDHSNAQVLIDSSKHPSFALLLAQSTALRLHVVHLTRDCRAVAHSWRRRKRRPEIHWTETHMPRYSVTRTSLKWLIHNHLSERLAPHVEHYVWLRYEDLVARPAQQLEMLLREFNLLSGEARHEIERLRRDNVVRKNENHSISGNPIRFSKEELQIVPDNAWREEMSWLSRTLAQLIGRSLQRKYGYTCSSSSRRRLAESDARPHLVGPQGHASQAMSTTSRRNR